MVKLVISYLILVVLSFIAMPSVGHLSAQSMGGSGAFGDIYNKNKDPNFVKPLDPNQTTDTLSKKKEPRPKKPLESYYFDDSVKKQNVFSWRFNPYNSDIKFVPIDTLLNNFQKDYIFLQEENAGAAYQGNLGAGSISLDYLNRPNATMPFQFLSPFSDYIYTPESVNFFNGKRPFTQLAFFMSGQLQKAEEQLRVLHSQNISPSTSFNIMYRNNGTKGMYSWQRAKQKNLSLAFAHTGKRYSVHGGYIYNMGDLHENGGMKNDKEVTDTIIDLPENIEMQLRDAKTRFRGTTLYVTQSYAFPFSKLSSDSVETLADKTAFYLGQSIEYSKYRKTYSDTKAQSGAFYANWFDNPEITKDSLSERRFDAKVFAQFQPYSRQGILGVVSGGAGYLSEMYYNFSPSQYLEPSKGVAKNSVYIYGSAMGAFRKYLSWNANLKFFPIGYRSGDIVIDGTITARAYVKNKPMIISLDALFRNETPSYWTQHYSSNHFKWNNSFNKETETRFGAKLTIPTYGIEVGVSQSVIGSKVYYNASSLPSQAGTSVSVSSIYLQKDFRLGGFHFNHRAKLQWSTNQEVVPLPLLSANLIYYYEFNVVKNVLRMQVGVDGYYNTKYYGFGYNPAISQFYNQRQVQLGNYPWLDAFVSGKWKRVRFLVKFQHANYDLFGQNNFFDIAHYPLNRRMLKLGVSWNFYD